MAHQFLHKTGLTEEERQAGELLSQGADAYQSYIDDATAMAGTLGQGFDSATREELLGDEFSIDAATPYMDIYQTAVDPAIREIERQTRQNLISDSAAAARSRCIWWFKARFKRS